MFKPVIAGFSRSPFTMARKGALIDSKPVNLLAEVIKDLVSKSNVKKDDICEIANDNADGQVIVSGKKQSVELLSRVLKEKKIKSNLISMVWVKTNQFGVKNF